MKEYVLDAPLLESHVDTTARAERGRYEKRCNEFNEVSCLMMVSITHGLQKRFEDLPAYDMICELKNIFQKQAHVKWYRITMELFECKITKRASVSASVQKLMGLMEQLRKPVLKIINEM
jgi:hypothetical protein